MAPLRLQIVVQPRALPSPSGATLTEPTVKWLEICHGDPTIQELSEILEARFFQRNHTPLNIKILKFLDDLELYPSYKVRDIFVDISNAQGGDKSLSTVKVYRNPPTAAELSHPRRLESLPPNSLARPKKQPLPPLFADAAQNDFHAPIEHRRSLRGYTPISSHESRKRQKVQALDLQLYTDPDRPLDSLESRHENPSRTAPQRLSPVSQVEDSQKRKRKLSEPQKTHLISKTNEGSDPYGTPISSQTGLHDLDKARGNEVISIPDSPSSRADVYSDESLRHPIGHAARKSRSPEIPTSNARSSQSEGPPSEIPPSALLPQSNQQHQTQVVANEKALGSLPEATGIPLSISREPLIHPSEQGIVENALRTPSPKQKDSTNHPGRLRRPKWVKQSTASKRTRKIINGVKQAAPSVFDPIETSEGSSYEREQLRSAKRSRTTVPAHESPKPKAPQTNPASKSPGSHFLIPSAPQLGTVAPSVPEASSDSVSSKSKSFQDSRTVSRVGASSTTMATTTENGAASASGFTQSNIDQQRSIEGTKKPGDSSNSEDISETLGRYTPVERAGHTSGDAADSEHARTNPKEGSASVSVASASPADDDNYRKYLKRQLEEAEENKRRAQAEFDRIAIVQTKRKQVDREKELDATQMAQRPPVDRKANRESASLAHMPSDGSQQLEKPMSLEEQRQYNLKHVTPGLNKQLNDMIKRKGAELQEEKEQKAAIKKQERAAQVEAQRQAKQARAKELKEQELATRKRAVEDRYADEQKAQARKEKNHQERSADQRRQEDKTKVTEHKPKLNQHQMANEKNSASAKFPMPTRIVKNPYAQQQEPQGSIEGKRTVDTKTELQARSQSKAGGAKADQTAPKVAHDGSKVAIEDIPPSMQQVVGKDNQTWLIERSPKAIYNARRQLQIANKILKHTRRDSTVVKVPRPAPKSTSMATNPSSSAQLQKAQPLAEKAAKKQRQEVSKAEKQPGATSRNFTDSEALRAAGLFVGSKSTAVAHQEAASVKAPTAIIEPTSTAAPSSSFLNQLKTPGSSKAAEIIHSSPSITCANLSRVRTMTPAIPSSSAKSNATRASAEAASVERTASMGSGALKTPARSALRAASSTLRRSVSFAHGSLPSSQSRGVSSKPIQVSGSKKGMLYRALEESNAKEAEAAKERSKSILSGLPATLNKVKKPPTRAKQTKLTQHVSRDMKLKGKGKAKAIDSPPPRLGERIVISSASEASTFYSDESEEERNARAGPSSRKKLGSILNLAKGDEAASADSSAAFPKTVQKRTSNDLTTVHSNTANMTTKSGSPWVGSASRPQSSVLHGQQFGTSTLPKARSSSVIDSGERTMPGPSQSTSYSDAESNLDSERESASRQTDDMSLLPQVNVARQNLLASSQQSSQKSTTVNLTSSQTNQRISSSLAPMSPKDQIEDARIARLRDERRQSEEADRQLRREHTEAMRRQSAEKAALNKQQKALTTSDKGTILAPLTTDGVNPRRDGPKEGSAANVAFDKSALSKLRKAQAAAEPINIQEAKKPALDPTHSSLAVQSSRSGESDSRSSSADSSDKVGSSQQVHPVPQASTASQGNRFTRFAKEIFGGKK
ncbi:MAG: hypothetical protein Q9225_005654 [Loekoesia sp. 1 TL-2023]